MHTLGMSGEPRENKAETIFRDTTAENFTKMPKNTKP